MSSKDPFVGDFTPANGKAHNLIVNNTSVRYREWVNAFATLTYGPRYIYVLSPPPVGALTVSALK